MTDVIEVDFRPALSDDRMGDYVGEFSALLQGMLEEHATPSQLVESIMWALAWTLAPEEDQ